MDSHRLQNKSLLFVDPVCFYLFGVLLEYNRFTMLCSWEAIII